MALLTWICIGLHALIALFLIIMLLNPGQDAAGKGMLGLPILLLLALAAIGWLLMKYHYHVAALMVTGLPVVIAVYIVMLTIRK